jgi:proteasome lid subunit RPN8/RPN11
MKGSGTDWALAVWSTPECPFRIEYAARIMDDIRLAVVDAFFSLPRGGAEIGGILWGRWEKDCLLILDYAPLDCEHATGPSFTLSARDEEKLRALLAGARSDVPGLQPIGWYHSHTRSEIFLSEKDLEVHNRYFPEPWQVALVLKPHTFQPARAGFFFREPSGRIHAAASYREIILEPLPMRPGPASGAMEAPKMDARPAAVRLERNPAIGVAAEQVLDAAVAPVAEPKTEESNANEAPVPPPPAFLVAAQAPPSRQWVAGLGICLLVTAAIGAYRTKDMWTAKVTAAVRPISQQPTAPPSLGLNAIDRDGQLQINWDRGASAVRHAKDATLEIVDGGPVPQVIALDHAHLQNGFFTYARQNERVDIKLILRGPEGSQVREVTTFLGRAPDHPAAENPEIRKERDRLAEEAAKLKKSLENQAARTRKLEKDLSNIKDEMKIQQQRRMANQLPDAKP